jgi:hypothetical protein
MNGTLSARFEVNPLGRIAISGFVLATLLAILVANLPESRLRAEAFRVAQPYLTALGLDQNWSVFAPEPRRASIDLHARVDYADGTSALWRPPSGSDTTGAYWDYRWRKWMENAIQDRRRDVMWRPAALFVAREMPRDGTRPVRVTLVRRWRDVPRAASNGTRPAWQSYAFYELPLREGPAR